MTVDNDFTGFTDSLGHEIYNGDTLNVPHSGQDSATMNLDGYDYAVRWDSDHGQWAVYLDIGGTWMKMGPLYKVAKKGTVKGEMP